MILAMRPQAYFVPFLPVIFRILRIKTTDKSIMLFIEFSKQNDHLLYLYLVVFVLTFVCYLGFSGVSQ